MPKGVEKASENPAALLLRPRRPSERASRDDQSFEKALLKDAQPRREVAHNRRTEPKELPRDEPIPEAESESTVELDEPTVAVEVASEVDVPVEEQPVESHEIENDDEIIAELLPLIDPSLLVDIPPILELPLTPHFEEVDVLAPAPVSDATPILTVTNVQPGQTEEPQDPLEIPAVLASANMPPETVVQDALQNDELHDEFPEQPIRLPIPIAQRVPNENPQSVPMDIAAPIVTAVEPIESDLDEGATDPQTPKRDPVGLVIEDTELDLDAPIEVAPAIETRPALATAPSPVAPRVLEIPEVKSPAPVAAPVAPPPPLPILIDREFAATNHERIVSSVRSQLLPNGGTMLIRLDPPELGALQIHVRMVDGVMNASFETSNENATRLLSHSLSQLKNALETQGVTVDRIQVQQTPRDQQASSNREDQHRQSQNQDSQAQREQQRRELMNRMWRRMRLGRDPLDMVA